MSTNEFLRTYDLTGQTFLITGGGGVLCGAIARGLYNCGANLVISDYSLAAAQKMTQTLQNLHGGGRALGVQGNVLQAESIVENVDAALAAFGKIDGLINGAGGNRPAATTSPEKLFFDLPQDALRGVIDLNLVGTIIPSQIVGRHMAERKQGVILNISSMNALRPLTLIPAYSASKAAVSNFTQWLAVHMAQEYSPNIRVNAIAPGFFVTEQNSYLMTNQETGQPTARGKKVLDHTPMARYGCPEDLIGTALWLLSPASSFVTGIVVPVDGGFSAYSGV